MTANQKTRWSSSVIVRPLGRQDYVPVFEAMQSFTAARSGATADELWLVEHPPVFTQGLAGKPEHLLATGDIPVVQTDRGGQVTYHGPGQVVMYPLIDVRRAQVGVRALVALLEQSVITLLAEWGIRACARPDAPGVYVNGAKIASVGLRIRHGCSYHGLSLNVAMDLEPFQRINPCGFSNLPVTQLQALGVDCPPEQVALALADKLINLLGYSEVQIIAGLPSPRRQDADHV